MRERASKKYQRNHCLIHNVLYSLYAITYVYDQNNTRPKIHSSSLNRKNVKCAYICMCCAVVHLAQLAWLITNSRTSPSSQSTQKTGQYVLRSLLQNEGSSLYYNRWTALQLSGSLFLDLPQFGKKNVLFIFSCFPLERFLFESPVLGLRTDLYDDFLLAERI